MSILLPAGAVLRRLELPARADAAPSPLIREYTAVRNACVAEETGRDDEAQTPEAMLAVLRGDADVTRTQWYVELDGRIVGCVPLNISHDGDGGMAIGTIALLKEHWGRGIGTAVLRFVEEQARTAGVRRLLCWNQHRGADARGEVASPTGFGAVPNDHAARFLQRHDFRLEQVERASELRWTSDSEDHLRSLQHEAQTHALDYRVVQWMLPTPSAHLDGYAWLKSRMSTDVPDAALDMPVERWDAERVHRHDARYAARGARVLVTAAQHIATGELCAFNELAIIGADAAKTDQEDTLVLAEHRGRRLGMLVKTAGLMSWRARYPESPYVVTYNAEENRPMLSINEAIGFTPVAYEGAWRKDLT